jgi:transforming growth factor-beta-induced protein
MDVLTVLNGLNVIPLTQPPRENTMITTSIALGTLMALTGQTCQSSQAAKASTSPSIIEVASTNGDFSTLTAALKAADLDGALSGEGPFTVFAPTNRAFASLPDGTVEMLLKKENKDALTGVLTYHVLAGQMDAEHVTSMPGAATLNGQWLQFDANDKGAFVDASAITTVDIQCSNGVIHVIDTVLIPSSDDIVTTAASTGTFNTLLAAATAAGLADTLANDGPYTVFAPTDDAFSKLGKDTLTTLLLPENKEMLQMILKNHVVSGRVYSPDALKASTATTLAGTSLPIAVKNGAARAGNAKLLMTDIDASNGVIHVIDTVLTENVRTSSASPSP